MLNQHSRLQLFNDYRFKRIEIERLRADDCIVSDTVKGSHAESPYTAHPIKVKGIDPQQVAANRERLEKLEAECADVEAAIAMAPNSQIRLVLTMRYIDGESWVEIGRQLGMSENACRMTAMRYLDGL